MTVTAEQAATETPAQQALQSASVIAEHVNRLDQLSPDLDDNTRVQIAFALKSPQDDLRTVLRGYLNRVGQGMDRSGTKMAVIDMPDGSQVTAEHTVKAMRSDVRRDDLVREVERRANDPQHRVDTKTGELMSHDVAKLALFKKCFRFEPRWTPIKDLGIDDDEFCRREWEPSVKLTAGGRL